MFNKSAKELFEKLEQINTGDKSKDKLEKIDLIENFAHDCYDDGYNDGYADEHDGY